MNDQYQNLLLIGGLLRFRLVYDLLITKLIFQK